MGLSFVHQASAIINQDSLKNRNIFVVKSFCKSIPPPLCLSYNKAMSNALVAA